MQKEIQETIAEITRHLNTATVLQNYKLPAEHVTCADGTVLSIQASEYHYCTPRYNEGPWTQVEVMVISSGVTPLNWKYDDNQTPETQLASWVPIEAVAKEIIQRGYLMLTK